MVSIEKTTNRYRGKMASNYERKRKPQLRWKEENAIVELWLRGLTGSVLDCPVGTGRFLGKYKEYKLSVVGVDSSEEMLAIAKKQNRNCRLYQGDAQDLVFQDRSFDHTVCVRFLDLIDEPAMRRVMQEFMRVTRSTIICTIRFGDKYVPKVNTATHDRRKFLALIKKHGWEIVEQWPIFKQGWTVLKIERRSYF